MVRRRLRGKMADDANCRARMRTTAIYRFVILHFDDNLILDENIGSALDCPIH